MLLFTLLDPLGQIRLFELKTLDARHRWHAPGPDASSQVVVLDISEASLNRMEPLYGQWPWPRQAHGRAVEHLARQGARAVAFDVIFSETSRRASLDAAGLEELTLYAENADVPEFRDILLERLQSIRPERSDARFVSRTAEADNVFFNCVFFVNDEEALLQPSLVAETAAAEAASLSLGTPIPGDGEHAFPTFHNAILPFEALARSARGVGPVGLTPDRDGVSRRFFPLSAFQRPDLRYPSLPLLLAAHGLGLQRGDIRIEETGVRLGERLLPLNPDGSANIVFRGPGPSDGSDAGFPVYAYDAVIASSLLEESGEEPLLPEGLLRDKIVLVGASAVGLKDVRPTPFSPVATGVEIMANIVDALVEDRTLTRLPESLGAVLLVLTAVCAGVLGSWRHALYGFLGAMTLLGASTAIGWHAFAHGVVVPLLPMGVVAVGSYLGSVILRYSAETREKLRIKAAFGHYLPPAVMEEALRDPGKLALGGERREITVLFSDIQGFTSLAESRSPEEVSGLLNEYFTAMAGCVLDTGGIVDKFIGDAVVAEWNAPHDLQGHAALACEAALRMQERSRSLNRNWSERGLPELVTRIGVNTGDMIIGNMGADDIFDYSVVGAEVNVGARLEGLNKELCTSVLVTDAARQAALAHDPSALLFRSLGRVTVRGGSESVGVNELMCRKIDAAPDALARAKLCDDAAERAFKGDNAGARRLLQDLLDEHEKDEAAATFLLRLGETPSQRST